MSYSFEIDKFGIPLKESKVQDHSLLEEELINYERDLKEESIKKDQAETLYATISEEINEAKRKKDEKEEEFSMRSFLDDDMVEEFANSIATKIAELQSRGAIPETKTSTEARDMIFTVIRRLYIEKSIVAKVARKLQSFGTDYVLKSARNKINRALG